jgi:hypothetical protein
LAAVNENDLASGLNKHRQRFTSTTLPTASVYPPPNAKLKAIRLRSARLEQVRFVLFVPFVVYAQLWIIRIDIFKA